MGVAESTEGGREKVPSHEHLDLWEIQLADDDDEGEKEEGEKESQKGCEQEDDRLLLKKFRDIWPDRTKVLSDLEEEERLQKLKSEYAQDSENTIGDANHLFKLSSITAFSMEPLRLYQPPTIETEMFAPPNNTATVQSEDEGEVESVCDFSSEDEEAEAMEQRRQKRRSSVANFITARRSSKESVKSAVDLTRSDGTLSRSFDILQSSEDHQRSDQEAEREKEKNDEAMISEWDEQRHRKKNEEGEGEDVDHGGLRLVVSNEERKVRKLVRELRRASLSKRTEIRSGPECSANDSYIDDPKPLFGACEEKGARHCMEDRFSFSSNLKYDCSSGKEHENANQSIDGRIELAWLWFAGVFDGHGGIAASTFLQEHLLDNAASTLDAAFTNEISTWETQRAPNMSDSEDSEEDSWHPDPVALANARWRRSQAKEERLMRTALIAAFQATDAAFLASPAHLPKALPESVDTNTADDDTTRQSSPDFAANVTYSGSTATVAVRTKHGLYCANTGDSRTVMGFLANAEDEQSLRYGAAQPHFTSKALSKDHKPHVPSEARRIHQRGGAVIDGRLMGSLAVSRAFGNGDLKQSIRSLQESSSDEERSGEQKEVDLTDDEKDKPLLIVDPDVTFYPLKPATSEASPTGIPLFVLLACDGLWDVMSDEEAITFVARRLWDQDRRRDADISLDKTKKTNAQQKLTSEEIQRAKDVFRNACAKDSSNDEDGGHGASSELDKSAFIRCIKNLIVEANKQAAAVGDEFQSMPSEEQLNAAFETADADNSGLVDEPEFIQLYEKVKSGKVEGFRGGTFSSALSFLSSRYRKAGISGEGEGVSKRSAKSNEDQQEPKKRSSYFDKGILQRGLGASSSSSPYSSSSGDKEIAKIAEALTDHAVRTLGSSDNVSVLIILLRPRPWLPPVRNATGPQNEQIEGAAESEKKKLDAREASTSITRAPPRIAMRQSVKMGSAHHRSKLQNELFEERENGDGHAPVDEESDDDDGMVFPPRHLLATTIAEARAAVELAAVARASKQANNHQISEASNHALFSKEGSAGISDKTLSVVMYHVWRERVRQISTGGVKSCMSVILKARGEAQWAEVTEDSTLSPNAALRTGDSIRNSYTSPITPSSPSQESHDPQLLRQVAAVVLQSTTIRPFLAQILFKRQKKIKIDEVAMATARTVELARQEERMLHIMGYESKEEAARRRSGLAEGLSKNIAALSAKLKQRETTDGLQLKKQTSTQFLPEDMARQSARHSGKFNVRTSVLGFADAGRLSMTESHDLNNARRTSRTSIPASRIIAAFPPPEVILAATRTADAIEGPRQREMESEIDVADQIIAHLEEQVLKLLRGPAEEKPRRAQVKEDQDKFESINRQIEQNWGIIKLRKPATSRN